MSIKLSENFSLDEMVFSQTASRLGIDNKPDSEQILNLINLCVNVLQPIRDFFQKPVIVTSGYRSKELNKVIGGSLRSHHMLGMAADINIQGVTNFELASWIAKNLKCTQVILEFYTSGQPNSGWVHVSYDPNQLRNEVLTINRAGTRRGLYA